MNTLVVFLCLVFLVNKTTCRNLNIQIAGIFDSDDEEEQLAFYHAVDYVNSAHILAPYRLIAETTKISSNGVFKASQTVCSYISRGVIGIFGPKSPTTSNYIHSLCDTKEIPHIDTKWNYQKEMNVVNLHPYPPVLSHIYAEIVKTLQWKSFTILYEDNDSFPRIEDLLKMNQNFKQKHFKETVLVKQLDPTKTGNYRPILMELKKIGETYFVIDCSIDILGDVLTQALQVGLMSDGFNYLITNLDLNTIELFPFQHGGANITGVQLIDPENPTVQHLAMSFQRYKRSLLPPEEIHPKTFNKIKKTFYQEITDNRPEMKLRAEVGLMFDSVYLFAEALRHILAPSGIELNDTSISCNNMKSWKHGSSMINYLKTQTIDKYSGLLKFDFEGVRSDFSLNIIELTSNGTRNIGNWNTSEGLNISRMHPEYNFMSQEINLQNKSFTVLIALTDPYNMLKETASPLSGNDRFEGYGIDLIHELSLLLGFNYTFKLQEDGNYGTRNLTTGEWNGMLREIMDGRADLGITDLTITSERESAVDFTMPFMNLGISILYLKPMKLAPNLFSFMSPFSSEVWHYLGGAYITVSLAMYIMARLSPAEWTNRYPCIEEPEFLENQFSLRNSFWFTLGSLMQQGSELAPIAISTRMVAGLWWFFTLIMVSSYTANLAAFLTVESLSSPFRNIDELVEKHGIIKFGAKAGGSTANFFRDSGHPAYQKVWNYMNAHPEMMTDSNPEGVKRAEKGDYAFFMESTTIEYTIQRHCNLTQIGGLLDDKGYGIAMRKNSPYRNILSSAVVKLQETGKLTALKNKWWKEKRGGGACHVTKSCDGNGKNCIYKSAKKSSGWSFFSYEKEEIDLKADGGSGDAQELDLANVGGVFFVLGVGSALGVLVGMCELMCGALKRAAKYRRPFGTQLVEEINFLFDFRQRTKPLRRSSSRENEEEPHHVYNVNNNSNATIGIRK